MTFFVNFPCSSDEFTVSLYSNISCYAFPRQTERTAGIAQSVTTAGIDMDTAVYCKIENGYRQAREEQVRQLALFYGIPYEELRRYWLAGKVYNLVEEEKDANGILYMVAEEMEGYGNHTTEKTNQEKIDLF